MFKGIPSPVRVLELYPLEIEVTVLGGGVGVATGVGQALTLLASRAGQSSCRGNEASLARGCEVAAPLLPELSIASTEDVEKSDRLY